MQQHPIPQNITGFEFKLIGDMTIKQFAYLAGFALVAYLTFASTLNSIIRFPLAFFFAFMGVALAFIPVEGRPLDRWITNFVRALFTPSQYIFHKRGGDALFQFSQTTIPQKASGTTDVVRIGSISQRKIPIVSNEALSDAFQTTPTYDKEEQEKLSTITQSFFEKPVITKAVSPPAGGPKPQFQPQPTIQIQVQPLSQPINAPYVAPIVPLVSHPLPNQDFEERLLKSEEKLEKEKAQLQEALEESKKKLSEEQASDTSQQVMEEALTVEKRLQEALSEKERLSQELTLLRQQLMKEPPPQTVVPSAQVVPAPSTQVHTIPPHFAKQAGIASLPQYPNIVSGIVKDAKGDILPNIIVEVKDQTDNPVRAFKTNKLGQFSASTSLANGHYTISLEDPKNTYQFEVIAIELTGGVFQPLEIMAKDLEIVKKQGERQQLHQALFGQNVKTQMLNVKTAS